MPTTDTLTMADAIHLAQLIRWCQTNARITWLDDEVGHDRPLSGTARCLGDSFGNRLPNDEDIRDGFLRISGTFEHFIPVREAVDMVARSYMIFED